MKTEVGEANRKKSISLMRMERKFMTKRNASINANPFQQRTGMTGEMLKSGERAGRNCVMLILKSQDMMRE